MPRAVGRLSVVGGGSKKKHQLSADLAVSYGAGILGDIDYATYCGLVWNRERAELRHAGRVVVGLGVAFAEQIPREAVVAMCETPEEAEEALAIIASIRASQATPSPLT